MKLWIDDIRVPPYDWYWVKSTNEAIQFIQKHQQDIELISFDHDAGDFAFDGGDYIKVMDWLEEAGLSYSIRIHTMNPVGRQNMQLICERNGWKWKS